MGRAGIERHHGRRAPAAGTLPRHARRRARARHRPLPAGPAAGRRLLAGLLGRPRRRERHHGGVLRPEGGGRGPAKRGDGARAGVRARARGGGRRARLHQAVAGPLRAVRLGRPARHAPGGDPAAARPRPSTSTPSPRGRGPRSCPSSWSGPAAPWPPLPEGAGVDELFPPSRPPPRHPLRPRPRAPQLAQRLPRRRPRAAGPRAPALEAAAGARPRRLRALDSGASGGRRLVGGHPAAVGLLADRAQVPRLRHGPPRHAPRAGRLPRRLRPAPRRHLRRAALAFRPCGTRRWW